MSTIGPCDWCARVSRMDSCWRIPTYDDGTLVREGDAIRFRQAPGGLMPRSEAWRYGVAARLPEGQGCDREVYLLDDGLHYHLFGHEIERAS